MVYTGSPPRNRQRPGSAAVFAHQLVAAGFGLVNNMFGKEQLTSLADFVQGSLSMLRYNHGTISATSDELTSFSPQERRGRRGVVAAKGVACRNSFRIDIG